MWRSRTERQVTQPSSFSNSLMSTATTRRSRQLFEERGLRVVAVDIGEFEKLEGCVTCLSVRLRHSP